MSLRIIFGRAGTGKSAFCLDEIKARQPAAEEYSPLTARQNGSSIMLVPEQFSFGAEKRIIHALGVSGLGGAVVYSFRRLATRICAPRLNYMPALTPAGKSMALYDILTDLPLTLFKAAGKEPDFAHSVAASISEFKRYGVTPDMLESAADKASPLLSMKLREMAMIYEHFEGFLAGNFKDSDDLLTVFADMIPTTAALEGVDIYIDEFSGFTPQEYSCIAALIKRPNSRVTVALCADSLAVDACGDEFAPSAHTSRRLIRLAQQLGSVAQTPIHLRRNRCVPADLAYMERAFFDYSAPPYPDAPDNVSLFMAANTYSEVEQAARQIICLCREQGCRYRDISLVTNALDTYEPIIRSIFELYDIPVFLDRNTPLINHPIVGFLISALEILLTGWSYESVFRYIKSGFLSLDRHSVDVLENYVLATGVRGNSWTDDDKWSMKYGIYTENAELTESKSDELEAADAARRLIAAPLISLGKQLSGKHTLRDCCGALYAFMEQARLPETVAARAEDFKAQGEADLASQYTQAFNAIIDTLDDMCATLGDRSANLRYFYELLRIGLGEHQIGVIPSALDQVIASDVSRSRGHSSRAVFLIGVNDGIFPSFPAQGSLLGDAERDALAVLGMELAPNAAQQIFEEHHLIYRALTIASTQLFVSYAASDREGQALRPSSIVLRLREIFPALSTDDDILGLDPLALVTLPNATFAHLLTALRKKDPNKLWGGVYDWFSNNPDWRESLETAKNAIGFTNQPAPLSPAIIDRLYGDVLNTSVSRLEGYFACPFSYFMQFALGAKARPILQLGAPDAGLILHKAIDEFSQGLDGKGWRDIDQEYILSGVDRALEHMSGQLNHYILKNSPRYAFLYQRLKRIVTRALRVIHHQITAGDFEPIGYEMSYGDSDFPLCIPLSGGRDMRLTGRIDRADIFEESNRAHIRIIDYKSGGKPFNLDDVFQGLDMQLATYMAAFMRHGWKGKPVEPAGLLYFRLDDPIIEARPHMEYADIEQEIIKQLKMKGLVVGDADIARHMDKSIQGYSQILPIGIGKDGGFYSNSSIAAPEQFKELEAHTERLAAAAGEGILSGNIAVSPYNKGGYMPCGYCEFNAVCAHDMGCDVRRLAKMNAKNVWEMIKNGGRLDK